MDTPKTEDKLAGDFFTLSNIVAGFCAAQSFVFLLSLGKQVEVANYLAGHKAYTFVICLLFSASYLAAIFGFYHHEQALRLAAGHSQPVRRATRFVHHARVILISSIAVLSLLVLTSLRVIPPAPAVAPAIPLK